MSHPLTTNAPAVLGTAVIDEETGRRLLPTRRRKARAPRTRQAKSYRIANVIVTIVLAIGGIIMIAPLLWTFSTSLKTREAVFALPPQWIPDPMVWENYIRVWTAAPLATGILNSIIVSASVTILGTIASMLAAFAFAKMRLPFKNVLFLVLLAAIMIPFPTIMIPQFSMFASAGLVDTLWPLILPGVFGNIVMVFFIRQYLASVPDSIIEAAKIDGAGYLRIFFTLIFPAIRPAIAAQFILWFMAVWNDYLAPIIYLNSPEKQTLQLVIASLNMTYASQTDYPLIMAGSFIALIPVFIVFVLFQRQIIESVALTGAKG
ncbi:carbohydrate ABC transporter permease [Microbacterium invictum]|uniref:Multiple sugar transport system permease protein n=1 Tax=Microbacterium invictum TaxID=515415 RepID=A0AA40SRK9_9MICO|nr:MULTISPECIES: carbohydrate ABC transporter permease [Microbacterium]MBB4141141.1 multiple sugar transport system permease protein [Microbacterium invictum]